MVETKGLIGSVEAADAMVKAANVVLIGRNTSVLAMSPCSCAAMSAREGRDRRGRRRRATRGRAGLGLRHSSSTRRSRKNPPQGLTRWSRAPRAVGQDLMMIAEARSLARAPAGADLLGNPPGTDRRDRRRHGRRRHAPRGAPPVWRLRRPATAWWPTRSRRISSRRATCTSSSGPYAALVSSIGSKTGKSSRSPSLRRRRGHRAVHQPDVDGDLQGVIASRHDARSSSAPSVRRALYHASRRDHG